MANPNISALNDLTAGTLAWRITSSQTINHQASQLTNWNTGNWSGNNSQSANITIADVSSYSTQANAMLVVLSADNIYGITSAGPTWTKSGGSTQNFTAGPNNSTAYFAHWYLMNPAAGAGTLAIPYEEGQGNSSSTYRYSKGFAWMFANVNPSDPFREQDNNVKYISETTSYSGDYATNGAYEKGISTNPGDLVYTTGRGEYNAGDRISRESAAPNADGVTTTVHYNANSSYHSRIHIATRGALSGKTDIRTTRNGGSSTPSAYMHRGFALKPASGTPLFTIPTTGNMVVKVNSIIAANPGVPDMLVEVEVTGMPASGGSYGTTLEDLTGDDLITNTTSVSSAFITRGVTVPNEGIHLLSKPFYMTRGMGLTAKAFAKGRTPTDFKDMDIIVSMEVIQS